MKKIAILLIALMVISVGFLSGCTDTEKNETDESEIIDDGINNSPKVRNVYASSTNVEVGESIDFSCDAIDYDGEIVSYYWYFGDGTNSTKQNPSHNYKESGTFYVTVDPFDNDGDSGYGGFIVIRVNDIVPDPEIIDQSSYTWSDWLHIVGIIKNPSSVCVNDVEIKATLYDSAGNVIKTSLEYNPYSDEYYYDEANPKIIEPRDTGCFKITFQDVSYYDHYGLEIYSYRTDFNEGYNDDLIVSNIDFSGGRIEGTIKNTGSNVYTFVQVHGIYYDKNGNIVSMETAYVGEVDDFYALYAGEESTFLCNIYSWELDTSIISDYELKIEYSKY